MLNEKFRYVAMDFEATGLDPKKDEAIQIGLVEIDINGNIIREFKSFLKPQKDIQELRDLVAYITGISLEDLQDAPSIFDLESGIEEFFGQNVILIGHNIQFDIDFLKKYFPNITYHDILDTMCLAQNLVHFAPSYALDVLVEYLLSKKDFQTVFSLIHSNKAFNSRDAHDALYDSKNALCLFICFMGKIFELNKKYPILSNFIQKNTGLYHTIIKTEVDRTFKQNSKMGLPSLERELPKDVLLKSIEQINLKKLRHGSKYFVGNVDIEFLISTLVGSNKNIILSFSSVAKLNIVKNILNEMGIKNIGYARDALIINKSKFNTFLSKKEFSDQEFLFIVKYLSHVEGSYSFLDLNTGFDYKINHYIQDNAKMKKYPIVLTSHGGLFSVLNTKEHLYHDYSVCFFDSEVWYNSYNFFLSNTVDLYSILGFLDNLYYKYNLDSHIEAQNILEQFSRFFEIFMGVLFTETKKHFINVQENYLTINPIIDHINFYETNKLISNFNDYKLVLESTLETKDFDELWEKIEHLFYVFSNIIQVTKVTQKDGDFYFKYSESVKYTNWDEFIDVFKSHTVFFSNFDKQPPKLIDKIENFSFLEIKKIGNMNEVVEFIKNEVLGQENDRIYFVLSTVKLESKELFEKMFAAGLDKSADLLVENITGSLGKNVFKAKSKGTKIIVGGYNFFMWILSNKINIDICIDFNISGKMSEYLLYDMKRYAKSNKKQ